MHFQLLRDDAGNEDTCASIEELPSCEKQSICKEVSVQRLDDYLHVTISRSSSKRRKINQRIVDSLTLVLEDAATDESEFVVISGLGDDTFCGIELNDLIDVPCEEEPRHYRKDVDKIRYAVIEISRKYSHLCPGACCLNIPIIFWDPQPSIKSTSNESEVNT